MKMAFELLELAGPLWFLFCAMAFFIVKGPKSLVFYSKWAKKFVVPCVGVEFFKGAGFVCVVLLEVSP